MELYTLYQRRMQYWWDAAFSSHKPAAMQETHLSQQSSEPTHATLITEVKMEQTVDL